MVLFGVVDLEFDLRRLPCKPSHRIQMGIGEYHTFFSYGLSRENFPKRTWNGEHASDPDRHGQ